MISGHLLRSCLCRTGCLSVAQSLTQMKVMFATAAAPTSHLATFNPYLSVQSAALCCKGPGSIAWRQECSVMQCSNLHVLEDVSVIDVFACGFVELSTDCCIHYFTSQLRGLSCLHRPSPLCPRPCVSTQYAVHSCIQASFILSAKPCPIPHPPIRPIHYPTRPLSSFFF